jgi:exonuclease SbcC
MILTQLKLTNFRSFGAGVIDFAPGQNYVFGMNWQGKSSVVDAIGFALFGNDVLPRRVAGAVVKAEHLLREGASRGRVELSFTLGEREYVIARSLPSHDAKLSCGGQVIASGVRRVAEQLKALLGIDAKLFQNVFYADQDELRKSLEFTPEDRRVFIERILGQELWRKRALAIGKTIRELEGFCDELRSSRSSMSLRRRWRSEGTRSRASKRSSRSGASVTA